MITSRPLERTWLKILASGSRGAGAGAAALGVGRAARCCVTIRAESVEGDSKVKRSKKTSELRFTDNSICWKLMMVVRKRLSCWGKIVQEGFLRGSLRSSAFFALDDIFNAKNAELRREPQRK